MLTFRCRRSRGRGTAVRVDIADELECVCLTRERGRDGTILPTHATSLSNERGHAFGCERRSLRWLPVGTVHSSVFTVFDKVSSPHAISIDERIDRLIESFQQPFWIDEHHWFVRCHWHPTDGVTLYTLPSSFPSIDLSG